MLVFADQTGKGDVSWYGCFLPIHYNFPYTILSSKQDKLLNFPPFDASGIPLL